ncbi:hypothetical protein PG993_010148 [Apiospora rasikravindrae]|uniref:Uncharacterized protein n=1 Tax=Apiospora rasikravindrae TaxID=990691 RepID=A0ABR1SLG0_9PEZI
MWQAASLVRSAATAMQHGIYLDGAEGSRGDPSAGVVVDDDDDDDDDAMGTALSPPGALRRLIRM